jgi:hypothetical protein
MARHENFNSSATIVYWTRRSQDNLGLYNRNAEVKASFMQFADSKGAAKLIKKLLILEAENGLYRDGYVSHVSCSDAELFIQIKNNTWQQN